MSRYGDLTERPRDHNYPSLNHEDDEDDEDTSAGFSTFADFNNKRRYSDNRLSSYNGFVIFYRSAYDFADNSSI